MNKEITDFLIEIRRIRKDAPWTAPATDAVIEATTALIRKAPVLNKRSLTTNALMLQSLGKVIEGAVRLYDQGLPHEDWGPEIDRVPSYARLILQDVNRSQTAGALTALSAELAPVEAKYGEAEVLTQDRANVPALLNEMAAALDFRRSALEKIDMSGTAYLTGMTLNGIGKADDDLALTFAEWDQIQSTIERGGKIEIQSHKDATWFGLATWAELGQIRDKMKGLAMREVPKGQSVRLEPMKVYVLGGYGRPSKDDSVRLPNEKDAAALFVCSEESVVITGPATFSEWDEAVLGPIAKKRAFFGTPGPLFKNGGEVMVLKDDLYLGKNWSPKMKLIPVITRAGIEKGPLLHDPHTPIAGFGENTMISYESRGVDGVAFGRQIYSGVMPLSIRDVLFEERANKHANPIAIGLPCALAMAGSSAFGPVQHKILSVERTSAPPTTARSLPDFCAKIVRMRAAVKYGGVSEDLAITASVPERLIIQSRRPGDPATLIRATGEEERIVKVRGDLEESDVIRIAGALLQNDPNAKVFVSSSPDLSGAKPDAETTLKLLLPGYDPEGFEMEDHEISDFGY